MPQPSNSQLEAFLDEALPGEQMARIEQQLRDDSALAERLVQLVSQRDAGVHTLGGIWRHHRLSCPTREQLGSYLLGAMPADELDYITFHTTQSGCRYCTASLADLRELSVGADDETSSHRRRRYYQSSIGRLGHG